MLDNRQERRSSMFINYSNHPSIKWQREQAILKTMKVRPDMIKKARLTPREMAELNREKEDREGKKDS